MSNYWWPAWFRNTAGRVILKFRRIDRAMRSLFDVCDGSFSPWAPDSAIVHWDTHMRPLWARDGVTAESILKSRGAR